MSKRDLRVLLAACRTLEPGAGQGVFRIVSSFGRDSIRFMIAVSPEGWPTLLLTIPSAAGPLGFAARAITARALKAIVVEIVDEPATVVDAVAIDCRDLALLDAFAAVAAEIIEAVEEDGAGWSEIYVALQRWSTLFSAAVPLDERILQGLWGELWVISRSAAPDILIAGWHGADGGVVDFVVEGGALEVKTGRRPFVHHVSYAQRSLAPDVTFFLSLTVETAGSGETISALLERISARVSDRQRLYAVVRDLGLSLPALGEYDKPRRLIAHPALFPMSAVPTVHGIDLGVTDVKYKVTLDAARMLCGKERRSAGVIFGLDETMETSR